MRTLGFLLMMISGGFTLQAQQKHALIIAIGNYPDQTKNGWPPLNALNDIALINEGLTRQKFKDIVIIKDREADKQGIVNALTNLIKRTGLGDIVVVHFSGHGLQLEDDNDDELDGLDEAIVPYGAVYSGDPGEFEKYEAGYIRDDEFGGFITTLRNKIGEKGDVLVTIDACHSGTGTRGDIDKKNAPLVRGGTKPMVSKLWSNKTRGLGNNKDFRENGTVVLHNNASPLVVISGAQAGENNYECWDDSPQRKAVGSLSYALSKALCSTDQIISYRALFASVENTMLFKAPHQHPVIETEYIDRSVFANSFIAQHQYFTITSGTDSGDRININGGSIAGISRGSIVTLFPPGTANPSVSNSIALGEIVEVTNFSASVKLKLPDKNLLTTGAWVFITDPAYEIKPTHLDIPSRLTSGEWIRDSLNNIKSVSLTPPYDLELSNGSSKETVILKFKTSGEPFGSEISLSDSREIENLKKQLKRYTKIQYLRSIESLQRDLQANIQFFLMKDGDVDSSLTRSRYANGRLELKEGDEVKLQVINTGDRSFYINIVDIQPDGVVNPILPNRKLKDVFGRHAPVTAEDCKVEKGDTLKILDGMSITIAPPYGNEIFKIFLSAQRIDLEELLTASSVLLRSGSRGALSRIEEIFADAENGYSRARGGEDTATTEQIGTIFSVPFFIVK